MEKRKQEKSSPHTNQSSAGINILGDSVTFVASIPPTETAIKIHGDGGARIILDVSESHLGTFLPAVAFRGKVLRVTFSEWEK